MRITTLLAVLAALILGAAGTGTSHADALDSPPALTLFYGANDFGEWKPCPT
jgi:hypothetical protein